MSFLNRSRFIISKSLQINRPAFQNQFAAVSFRNFATKNVENVQDDEFDPSFLWDYMSEFEYEDDVFDFLSDEDLAYLENEQERISK